MSNFPIFPPCAGRANTSVGANLVRVLALVRVLVLVSAGHFIKSIKINGTDQRSRVSTSTGTSLRR